ncbi:MAG: TMEM175 family protein [Ginsengibacter sp.]
MPIDKQRYTGTERLEMFSDGVFAISITILVLELIQMLHFKTREGLLKTLWHNLDPFLAFFIGFVTILICWINHSHAFRYIHKADDKFMWVNGFLLFMVTLTPFPTAILAEFIQTEGKTALLIFGFNYIMIAFAAYFICRYAYNNLLVEEDNREYFYFIQKTYFYSIFYTIIVFIIGLISIPTAIVLYILMFVVFAFPNSFTTFLYNRRRRKIMMPIRSINRRSRD